MNTLEAFRTLLLSITALTALISTRIFYQMPKGAKANFPCVLITRIPAASSNQYILEERECRVDVRCYGDGQPAANAVYAALRDGIAGTNGLAAGSFYFESIIETIEGADLPEQVTDEERWDCVFSTYLMSITTA